MALQKGVLMGAFGLLLAVSTPLLAQETKTTTSQQSDTLRRREPREKRNWRKHKRIGVAFRELNLSEEQKQQTQVILQRHVDSIRSQREELSQLGEKRRSGTLTPEDQARAQLLHQQLREARDGVQAELKNLLTVEQRNQLEQIENERKARREERLRRREELAPPRQG
jgi:Spy/CpxP family protein refolding chaperone